MADLVNELNNLDFAAYISGPMQAAVEAQNTASFAQVDFIRTIGFVKEDNNNKHSVRMVEFTYNSTNSDGSETTKTLKVPLLTMVNVPSLRIDDMSIDFNAKLNSLETKDVKQSLEIEGEVGLNLKRFNFKISAAYKRDSTTTSRVERTYSMNVHVHVVNDELPAGLDRVLSILENEIKAEDDDARA